MIWVLDTKGNFSVKSAYLCSQNVSVGLNCNGQWNKVWKLKLHERLRKLIWRIGSGILLTNMRFVQKVGFGDPYCPLCHQEESFIHLFFHCPLTKIFWFGQRWGLHPDKFNVQCCDDFIKLFTDPPVVSGALSVIKNLHLFAATQLALTMECIWKFRNDTVFGASHINPLPIIKGLDHRISEHILAANGFEGLKDEAFTHWIPPPPNMIKLNTDATVRTNSFSIAVVARDNLGNIRRAWSKQLNTIDPVVAKATAITWALEIVNDEGYQQIIVESDSKICIKAFSENSTDVCWKLAAFCYEVYAFSLQFVSCCFSWTKREANATAHELAKFATSVSSPFCCNDSSLPPSVFEAW